MQHKLVFIETTDVLETTLALDNFRRACDCGRGAAFFSVARGKVCACNKLTPVCPAVGWKAAAFRTFDNVKGTARGS